MRPVCLRPPLADFPVHLKFLGLAQQSEGFIIVTSWEFGVAIAGFINVGSNRGPLSKGLWSGRCLVIPEDVSTFIRASVRSIWGLEALLLLRSAPDQTWSPEGLSAALRGAVPLMHGILDGFVKAGIAQRREEGGYYYAPNSDRASVIDKLAKLNAEFPLAVAKAIVLAPNDKVQTFVDAFKIK